MSRKHIELGIQILHIYLDVRNRLCSVYQYRHIVLVSGPGVCSSDYSLFLFKHLPRPMYPLDADASLADSESWCTASVA